MTAARLNIFARVIKRRMDSGESLEQILESYSKLSDEEKQEIRSVLQNNTNVR